MRNFYSWIYLDHENDLWKFSLGNNSELCYQIMYGERKETREGVIDKNVLGYAVYIEKDGKIHIIYSNENGQIKYCTLKENKWYGRTLYLMDSSGYNICNIKIEIIGDEMHIFYLLIEKEAENYGVLVHSIWNGRETRSSKLSDIVMMPYVNDNYIINIDNGQNISLLFITEEGTRETTLNYCCYKDREWSRIKRLYSIKGQDIAFGMLSDQKYVHILNKHREQGRYYLDHVRFAQNDDIQKFKVYESDRVLEEPLCFRKKGRLYACWVEENKIFYSVFNSSNWSDPVCSSSGNDHKVRKYHFYIACDNESKIFDQEIYAAGEKNLELFFPSEFTPEKKLQESGEAQTGQGKYICEPEETENPGTLQSLKLLLYRERSENSRLKSSIASLSSQVQKTQNMLDTYKDKYTKLLEQKKNTDENCDMFIGLQQDLQRKLEESDNKLMKMTEERDALLKELEAQKNKTIMERLLKM